jgi:hypothetical protein
VDRELLYAILVTGGRHKPATWALWGFMPVPECASPTDLEVKLYLMTIVPEGLR